MKKQNLHRNGWLEKRAVRLHRHRKRRIYRKHRSFVKTPIPRRYKGRKNGGSSLVLPQKMDFEGNAKNTLQVFRVLRRIARGESPSSYIDFDSLSEISPEAAVVLASEIDLWDRNLGRKLRAKTNGWDPNVKELLREMGFFDLLNVDNQNHVIVNKKTVFLKIISSDLATERNGGIFAVDLREEVKKFAHQIDELSLYDALSEALMNVIHHAYSGNMEYKSKLFWMSASYELDTGKLSVVFYDQGKGIPKTVKTMGYYERFRASLPSNFLKLSDAEKLCALVHKPRSSVDIQGRGNGIPKMIELAKGEQGNTFTIISRKGSCVTKLEKGKIIESVPISLPRALRGTLITWELYI